MELSRAASLLRIQRSILLFSQPPDFALYQPYGLQALQGPKAIGPVILTEGAGPPSLKPAKSLHIFVNDMVRVILSDGQCQGRTFTMQGYVFYQVID
jgi:hypothetical protein